MLISKIEPSENGVFVGGSVNALLSLIGRLGRDGVNVEVLTSLSKEKQPVFDKFKPKNAKFTVLGNNLRAQSVLFGAVFLFKSLLWGLSRKFGQFDVIHGHSGYAIYAWITYLVSRCTGASCVHTIYCPVNVKGTVGNSARYVLRGKLALYALRRLDMVVAMSDNISASLIKFGVERHKVVVMPTAVDTKKFSPRPVGNTIRPLLNLSASDLVVLFVGNLMWSKGLDVLIEAIGVISRQTTKVKLVITLELKHSGFNERVYMLHERINRLGIKDIVIELGMIDYMPKLIAEADVVVSPYRDTQGPSDFPLAMMEAMSSERCVLGTTVGGMPELIEDGINGRLVAPDNVESLSACLLELLGNPVLRRNLGFQAREKIMSLYSQEKVADEHLKMYGNIVSN